MRVAISLTVLVALVASACFLVAQRKPVRYLDSPVPGLEKFKEFCKEDGRPGWRDEAMGLVRRSEIVSDEQAILVAGLMKKINASSREYSRKDFADVLVKGVAARNDAVAATMRDQPEKIRALLKLEESPEVMAQVIGKSLGNLRELQADYLKLMKQGRYDEMRKYLADLKEFSVDPQVPAAARLCGIIMVMLATPAEPIIGVMDAVPE